MRVVIPYAVETPKTRLDPVLDADERREFARAMLADVLDAVAATDGDPTVLATDPFDCPVDVIVDERPLTTAVNDALSELPTPVAIVMADLPLVTGSVLEELFAADGDVVLAPGRGGGTNAIVRRTEDFRVDYHGGSFIKHRRAVESIGANLAVVDSHRLATDIDEPADIVEVIIHGEGRAAEWLADRGFELDFGPARLDVRRSE